MAPSARPPLSVCCRRCGAGAALRRTLRARARANSPCLIPRARDSNMRASRTADAWGKKGRLAADGARCAAKTHACASASARTGAAPASRWVGGARRRPAGPPVRAFGGSRARPAYATSRPLRFQCTHYLRGASQARGHLNRCLPRRCRRRIRCRPRSVLRRARRPRSAPAGRFVQRRAPRVPWPMLSPRLSCRWAV